MQEGIEMKKYLKIVFFVIVLLIASCKEKPRMKDPINAFAVEGKYYEKRGFVPKDSLVPTDFIAIKIAEAAWLTVYHDEVYNYWPFTATLNEERQWVVKGTKSKDTSFAGVPIMVIEKFDGRIVRVDHVIE